MPTPASLAIARIDGSVPAEANKRVATSSSCSRLRVASARGLRASSAAKTDHAPVVLGWITETEHNPFTFDEPLPETNMKEPSYPTSAPTGRAVQFESFGGPEALSVREV